MAEGRVTFQAYLSIVVAAYTRAEERLDFEEAIRVLGLVRDVCGEQIEKLAEARRRKLADEEFGKL